jgi:plasmid stabilization system protein ParE
MTYRFTSAAEQDLAAALEYYEDAQPGLGTKFLDELEAAIGRIIAMPQAWKVVSRRTRRCLFHRFPFAVLYEIRGDEIVVAAIMELRRDPAHWLNRI